MDLELLAAVQTGLGSLQETKKGAHVYRKSPECLDCLKDLQRFLRRDDPDTRDAFFKLGQGNTIKHDIVPIIVAYANQHDLVYNAVKVLTFMTMPVDQGTAQPQQQVQLQQLVKAAVLEQREAVTVIAALLAGPLEQPRMSEEQRLTVQLVLTLFRNLLAIPDPGPSAGSKGHHLTRLQVMLLEVLHEESVLELLLYCAAHSRERALASEAHLLLEIFAHLFTPFAPSILLAAREPAKHPPAAPPPPATPQPHPQHQGSQHASRPRSSRGSAGRGPPAPAPCPMDPAVAAMQAILAKSKGKASTANPARHGRFVGNYIRRSDPSSDFRVLVKGTSLGSTPLPPITPAQGPGAKGAPGAAKAADMAAQAVASSSRAAAGANVKVAWLLRQCAEGFLWGGGYDTLMGGLRKQVEAGLGLSQLTPQDMRRFLQLAAFFTHYTRLQQEVQLEELKRKAAAGEQPAEGVATSEQQGLRQGQGQSPYAAISATMGWETFHAVRVMWISQLDVSSKDKDWGLQHATTGLLREMLAVLELAQRCGPAADRAASDRLQRRLLHDDQRESGLLPVVGRMMKTYSAAHSPPSHAADLVMCVHVVLRMYDRLCGGSASSGDGASGFLVRRKVVARGAGGGRKKVPDADEVVGSEAEHQGEGADRGEGADGGEGAAREAAAGEDGEAVEEEEVWQGRERPGGLDPLEELHQDEEVEASCREVVLDLKRRLRQELAVPAVVQLYTWLLHGYLHHPPALLHAACSFLWRIILPDHLDLQPMLYQLSVLRLFYQVLSDHSIRGKAHYKELLALATHVVKGLFSILVPPQPPASSAAVGTTQQPTHLGDAPQHGAAAAEGGAEEGEDASSAVDVAAAEREGQVNKALASMAFVEVLFWTPANVADEVREGYFLRPTGRYVGGLQWDSRQVDTIRGMAHTRLEGDSGDDDAAADVPPGASALHAPPQRSLAEAAAALRAQMQRVRGGGGGRSSRRRGEDDEGPVLSGEQAERLQGVFPKYCGARKKSAALEAMAGEVGEEVEPQQVRRAMKELGLKFGQLTPPMVRQLSALHEQFCKYRDCYFKIAAELPGGFSKKGVKKLLQHHGFLSLAGSDSEQGGGSSADDKWGDADLEDNLDDAGTDVAEAARQLEQGDVQRLKELYMRHHDSGSGWAAAVAAELGVAGVGEAEVVWLVGMHCRPKRVAEQGRKVDVRQLREAYALCKDEADWLNKISAQLPGGFTAQQVKRLLKKHGLLNSGSSRSKQGAVPAAVLQALYLEHHGKDGWLEAIAEGLLGQWGEVSPRQVMRLLKKNGILEKTRRSAKSGAKGLRRRRDDELGQGPASGNVPEPDAVAVLAYLVAMHRTHGGQWMDGKEAAAWVLGKLEAAEKLWGESAHGPTDYALVPEGDEDVRFFCSPCSNELLNAAGVRDDEGDYFKIPGNSTPSWRGRVRAMLEEAAQFVDQPEGEGALEMVPAAAAAAAGASLLQPSPAAGATLSQKLESEADSRGAGRQWQAAGRAGRPRHRQADAGDSGSDDGGGGGGSSSSGGRDPVRAGVGKGGIRHQAGGGHSSASSSTGGSSSSSSGSSSEEEAEEARAGAARKSAAGGENRGGQRGVTAQAGRASLGKASSSGGEDEEQEVGEVPNLTPWGASGQSEEDEEDEEEGQAEAEHGGRNTKRHGGAPGTAVLAEALGSGTQRRLVSWKTAGRLHSTGRASHLAATEKLPTPSRQPLCKALQSDDEGEIVPEGSGRQRGGSSDEENRDVNLTAAPAAGGCATGAHSSKVFSRSAARKGPSLSTGGGPGAGEDNTGAPDAKRRRLQRGAAETARMEVQLHGDGGDADEELEDF